VVQQLPDPTLQSLTGSGFAYLQRVDTALGNPVDLAALLGSEGLDLPTTPSSIASPPTTAPSPSAAPRSGAAGTAPAPSSGPTVVPTLPIPTDGQPAPRASTGGSSPKLPSISRLPSIPRGSSGGTGGGGGTSHGTGGSRGTTGTAPNTATGVLRGVTGNGPSLPLPTSVPTPAGIGR
jgi:hypothetical protein